MDEGKRAGSLERFRGTENAGNVHARSRYLRAQARARLLAFARSVSAALASLPDYCLDIPNTVNSLESKFVRRVPRHLLRGVIIGGSETDSRGGMFCARR